MCELIKRFKNGNFDISESKNSERSAAVKEDELHREVGKSHGK